MSTRRAWNYHSALISVGPASNAGITSSTGLASKIDLALRDQILIVSVENVSTWHLLGLAYFLTGLVSAGLGSN